MKNRSLIVAALVMVLLCVGLIFLGLRHENAGGGSPGQSQTTDEDTQSQAKQDITATLAVCGDIMKMYMKINDEGVIEDIKFKTFGCGAAIATSSMATEMIKCKPLSEALQLTYKAVVEALDGLPPVKVHCSVLAEQAIKHAIADYYRRNGIDPTPFVGELTDPEACHVH